MNKRLSYLREQHGADLLAAFKDEPRNAPFRRWLERDGSPLDDHAAVDIVFQRFRESDPSPTGSCTQWLIRLAAAGRLPAEDLPKARETLAAFLAYKRRLDADARDLGRYDTLGAVWRAVEPFAAANAPVSGKDEERRERVAARAESTILLEEDGLTVAIPRTERAAKWWGRGTRWCTAADDANMFKEYNDVAPLVVFVLPDGRKFQGHAGDYDVQFMDAADEDADFRTELRPWGRLLVERLPGLVCAMTHHPEVWKSRYSVWGHRIGGDDRRSAVLDYGAPYQLRPIQSWSEGDLLIIAQRDPDVLEDLKPHQKTRAVCRAVIDKHGYHLRDVPEALRDAEMCWAAVRQNAPSALEAVPVDLRTRDLCLEAVRHNGNALRHVPEALRDEEMLMTAVTSAGSALLLIPKEARTRELTYAAVGSEGRMYLVAAPPEFRTTELALKALECDKEVFFDLPVEMRSEDFQREAVRRNPLLIGYVSESLIDDEMAQAAVRANPKALLLTPWKDRSRALCLEAVLADPHVVGGVPNELLDDAFCRTLAHRHRKETLLSIEAVTTNQTLLSRLDRAYAEPRDIDAPEALQDPQPEGLNGP